MTPEELRRELAAHPFFDGYSSDEVATLADAGLASTFHKGDVIIREGWVDDTLHVMLSGRANITSRGRDGRDHHLATAERGSVLGEVGFLGGGQRTATVTALEQVEGFSLPGATLDALLESGDSAAPKLLRKVARGVAQRQQGANQRIIELIEEASGATQELPSDDIRERLARAIRDQGL